MYANKELSEKLYKLSQWEDNTFDWWGVNKTYIAPRYSLGYLLRKLPSGAGAIKNSSYPKQTYTARRPTMLGAPENKDPLNGRIGWDADTPENALCIMAIELFNQGILPVKEMK